MVKLHTAFHATKDGHTYLLNSTENKAMMIMAYLVKRSMCCDWHNPARYKAHTKLILFTLLLVHLILYISPLSHTIYYILCHLTTSPVVTPSVFHSRLKTHLFQKSFPSQSFWLLPDCLH